MYFVRAINVCSKRDVSQAVVASSLDVLKRSLVSMFITLSYSEGETIDEDNPEGWYSLSGEVEYASSFEEIADIVSEFERGSGTYFEFYSMEDGEIFDIGETE